MHEYLMRFIGFIGYGNFITIITFIISLFFAYYFYFKNFYRLVYSLSKICPNSELIFDWQNEEAVFLTRVLFYNNGRKSLSKNEVKKLDIISSGDVLDYSILKGEEFVSLSRRKNNIKLKINRLDKSKFILIEVSHKGGLLVDGEISESGELLCTETKSWLIINYLIIIISVILSFLLIFDILEPAESNTYIGLINILSIIGFLVSTRYIHSLFFIPDSITDKYLEPTDKFSHSFKDYK